MKIAITGATGQLGKLVIGQLKQKIDTDRIVALVRTIQKAGDLGVGTREADYSKFDTLENALAGIDTLLLISGSEIGKRTEQHKNVIEAAKQAGIQRIIYTSLLHADTSSLSLAAEHLSTEKTLKESAIAYTILRNGWYTENYLGSISGALASGLLLGSAENGKIASATRSDYAEAAVNVLTSKGHENKTYELAGDEAYTLSDLAAEISRQSGKDIKYLNLPENEYATKLLSFGLPEELAHAIAGWDTGVAKGDLFDDGHQLSTLIGRPTTPLAQAISEALKLL